MSALYAESSAVLRWLLGDATGIAIERALRQAPEVVTSALTATEVARTLARLDHEGRVNAAQRTAVSGAFSHAQAHWKIRTVTDEILQRAAAGFPIEPVRTLDAIHLATALLHARDSGVPLVMLSTDARIRNNAGAFGFAVVP